VTTSEYPPEALDILIAMRRASAAIRPHHKAVVVAWVRGANVGDGDPVTNKGLRWSLVRVLDEMHRISDRRHRKAKSGPTAALDETLTQIVPNTTDRRLIIDASASVLTDAPVDQLTEFAAPQLAEIIVQRLEALGTRHSDNLPATREERTAGVAALLRGKTPTGKVVDLSITAAAAAVVAAPRTAVDAARDSAVLVSGVDVESASIDDLLGTACMASGILAGMAAQGDWEHGQDLDR
jgi:hypothetical protein